MAPALLLRTRQNHLHHPPLLSDWSDRYQALDTAKKITDELD
jgi:hypothetical protein